MNVMSTEIPDVLVIEPDVFRDERGYFMESWNARTFADAGIDATFVQDNHSHSVGGTLRGLHYQLPPHAQGKLVRVTVGEVFDVAVDIRRNSKNFGKWVGEYLSADNKRQLWIPPGFAHGFLVTSELVDLQYKCTDYYSPECEASIRWDDPSLDVDWPLAVEPRISSKDAQARAFIEAEYFD